MTVERGGDRGPLPGDGGLRPPLRVTIHTCEPADPASKGGSESTVKIAKAVVDDQECLVFPARMQARLAAVLSTALPPS